MKHDSATTHPVRVLEVVRSLASGGMETQLVALMNRLDPARHHFEVCCLHQAGVKAAQLDPRIPVHVFEKPDGFQWSTVSRLRSLLAQGFDVVHTHNLGSLIYAALATYGGRTCAILHGEHSQFAPDEQNWKRRWQRRLLYPCCAAVHTVSAGQKDEWQAAGIGHHRFTALVNGVNAERFRPCDNVEERAALRARLRIGQPGDVLIGIVGRFGDFKRHLDLIAAFEKIAPNFPQAQLVMVGDGGPLKDRVLARAQSSCAAARIHWAGYQSDTLPFYQALDLLVVASTNEGLSNVTLEAMSCALPVLSHDNCGARELLGADIGGWVRDLGTVEALATGLKQILALPATDLANQGTRGRARVLTNFSWQGMADQYSAWFHACAGSVPFPAI